LKSSIHKWKHGDLEEDARKELWERDYQLPPNPGLIDEYLELGLHLDRFNLVAFIRQATYTCVPVTKQYNLVPAEGVISLAVSNRGLGGK